MTESKRTSNITDLPLQRLSFPEDEARFPWLPMLLDAYAVVDKGVRKALVPEHQRGRRLACAKGCSACCRTHKDIPVYPLELVGITWYATEKLQEPLRAKLKAQLRNHAQREVCPFLVDGICSIHPMRPMACRQFNVFEQPCAEGEDPYHTRRADVLRPIPRFADEAFFLMLPFYGIADETQRRAMVASGGLHRLAKELRQCNWESLAARMAEHDVADTCTQQ